MAAASVTDAFDARAAPPADTMRSAVVSVGAWSWARPSTVTPGSTVTTYAPVRPTASAMAAPIPAPPPVTTTTCCRSAALLSAAKISPFDVAPTPSLKARLRSPPRSAGRRSRPVPASRGATSGTRRSRPSRPGRYPRAWVRPADITLEVQPGRGARGHEAAGVEERAHDLRRPLPFGLGRHVGDPDAALLQHRNRLGDVLRAFDGQVRVVDGHDRLESRRGHEEHVREARGHEAVQRDRPFGELLGDRHPAAPDDGVRRPAREGRELRFETGRVDDAVEGDLLAVDDHTPLGDPLDARGAVDEGHVVAVERRKVLVVEARSFAHVAVVRLEALGHASSRTVRSPVSGAPPSRSSRTPPPSA